MKIFMDTADVKEIAEFADLGVVYGVTTNPSLIAKTGRTQAEVIPEICKLIPGPVSAEVISTECAGMVKEARNLVKIAQNVVVKIACIPAGRRHPHQCDAGVQPGTGAAGRSCRRRLCQPLHRPLGRYRRKRRGPGCR